jgi:ATP-dependent Lon protease
MAISTDQTTKTVSAADEEKKPQEASSNKPTLFPLVALRDGVVFPHTESVLVFGRDNSKQAVSASEESKNYIIVAAQKDGRKEHITKRDIYKVATLCKVERTLAHEGDLHVLIRGIRRVSVAEFAQEEPYFLVTAKELTQELNETDEFKGLLNYLVSLFKKTIQAGKPVEFFNFIRLASGVKSPEIIDHIASTLDLQTKDKQALLEELDVNARLQKVINHLTYEQKILNIEQNINQKTKQQLDERMRESILRERMNVIQKELGDSEDDDVAELKKKLKQTQLPKNVHDKITKEIRRLSQMSAMHSEYAYLHTWVETVLSLPWNNTSTPETSLKKAAEVLDAQHYGLEKVKERVLEHLAVMQLRERKHQNKAKKDGNQRSERLSTILCFVGPPGVGKTSIGRSIAEALGREFVKVSLGGIHDESEIRGHRRTYVGAMPGRIIQGISQIKSKNPVFVLDEIDKLGSDFRGDPAAALLEALDPEQNHEFTDHYLGIPFDLSDVMFITTANVLHTIPAPLRDRLEVVEYAGYTTDEKFQIARRYLLPQVSEGSGLDTNQLTITDKALTETILHYTREAGVRQLKRALSKIARKVARVVAESKKRTITITPTKVSDYLGPPQVFDTITEKEPLIGLVNGLAWTSVGGELLPIEASVTPGKEGITLTGQLGKVMQESAHAALTYIKSHINELELQAKVFEKQHVHIHVPEGAVPKDGPSAGIAMTVALASVYSGLPVHRDVAMTGEVTLRGRVLPIGGLKEKIIAAHRARMKTIFIPSQNAKDLVEIPQNVRDDVKIIPVEHVREVIEHSLIRPIVKTKKPGGALKRKNGRRPLRQGPTVTPVTSPVAV